MAALSPEAEGQTWWPPDSLILAIFLSTGALSCHNGTMVKFGSGFTKEAVDWSPQGFIQAGPKEICQETFLIVDVGVFEEMHVHTPAQAIPVLPCLLFPAVPAQLPSGLGSSFCALFLGHDGVYEAAMC